MTPRWPVGASIHDRFVFSTGLLELFGVRFGSVEFAPRGTGIGTVLSWNDIKPGALETVTPEMIRDAIRRWFAWDDFVARLAHTIFRYDAEQVVAIRDITTEALADDWPAKIENAANFLAFCRATQQTPSTVSLGGLIGLLADALADPWTSGSEVITDPLMATRRWARLLMLAAGAPEIANPAPLSDAAATPYQTQRTLLPAARLGELDDARAFLVRSGELYCEFLAELFPPSATAFKARFGCDIGDWIVRIADLVGAARIASSQHAPLIDFSAEGERANIVRELLQRLSLRREDFEQRLQTADAMTRLKVLRQFPILRFTDDKYLLLHTGFILAAADDGVWYGILDALETKRQKSEFSSKFGDAIEQYVRRILDRCAAQVPNSVVVKLPEGGRLRCDFAWRIGDALILIDAKRAGLNARMLVGDEEIAERLDADLGRGCRQILATIEDGSSIGWDQVAPGVGVSSDWRPTRVIAWLVTHRPVYMWFSSVKELLQRTSTQAEWQTRVGPAGPLVLSISELELFEAALPQLNLGLFIERVADDDARTVGGLGLYLNRVGYNGPALSDYYMRRFEELGVDSPWRQ